MSRTSEAAKPRGVAKVFEASVCTAPCQQGVQIHTSRSACACINASLTWAERVKPSLTVDQNTGRKLAVATPMANDYTAWTSSATGLGENMTAKLLSSRRSASRRSTSMLVRGQSCVDGECYNRGRAERRRDQAQMEVPAVLCRVSADPRTMDDSVHQGFA